MNKCRENKPVCIAELLESIRRLAREDREGFTGLINEISRDVSLGIARDVISLGKALALDEHELMKAVESYGLLRTVGVLHREAQRRKSELRQPDVSTPVLLM